ARGPFPDVAEDSAAGLGSYCACAIELIAEPRIGGTGEALPLGFGRQPRPGPAGEGVGLEIADVGDGRGPVDCAAAAEREFGPAVAPVQWRRDLLALDPLPALGQPQSRGAIAAVLNELAPVAVGHGPIGDVMRFEENTVARA